MTACIKCDAIQFVILLIPFFKMTTAA